MSNIVTRTRTDARMPDATGPQARIRRIALVIASVIFGVLLISFRPFTPAGGAETETGGDIINQLGFSCVGAVALASMAMFANLRKLAGIIRPGWLVMLVFLFASIFASSDPATAVRGVLLTTVGIVAIIAVLVLPQDGDGYSALLVSVASVVIVVSYAGVVLLPSLGTHGADAIEPQNSFLWRGVFSHKNIAGPVMAVFAFAGLYLWRRGWKTSGLLIGLSALGFVSQTGSKTTMALVPFAMLLVVLPGLMGLRKLTAGLIFAIQLAFATFTFGVVLFEPIRRMVENMDVDATFTGRVSIWKFALEALSKRPWTGYGYESFWSSAYARHAARPYYLDWDVRGIVHGHNSYLDVAMTMGIPALLCAIAVIIVMPLVHYARCRPVRENMLLADFFLMIVLFGTLNAMMESFFFRRMDPVWLTLILAIFGLGMTAKVVIPKRSI
ncbi:O-antigen ligase family protein [Brucella sp. 6810]|uniref:O-antigen ligase family protein n=1 Tax=Brucella sp. 6810 TaxID=2769351 RepID=UPI00165C1FA8|nr:O-antigen ligase [Brucella sp. 6810]QNQ63960.1 O-antigen ligase family protein [Brucella sp. 6810]